MSQALHRARPDAGAVQRRVPKRPRPRQERRQKAPAGLRGTDGRVLPLRGELLELFERSREKRRPDSPYVFHDDGEPIGDFRKAWKTACKNAGISGIIVHDLRRTAVRNMVRAGIPERVAMELSGHKTRRIFDRYNIVSNEDLAAATELLQSQLSGPHTRAKVTSLSRRE